MKNPTSVCIDFDLRIQVAAEQGFREVLLEQLVQLLAPRQAGGAQPRPLLQAGPSDNLCRSPGNGCTAVI